MLLPLPTPEEMSQWDQETIKNIGIPGLTLMESASREAVDVLLEEFGPIEDKEILCFAGSGNNGGDVFAMARQLQDLGADVTVFHTKHQKQYQGETRTNLIWAQKLGVPLRHLAAVDIDSLPMPDIIIDGLLGTGFKGELSEDYLACIRSINIMGHTAFVFSVDIPSGLNGLTGQPQPEAIMADATVTFQAPKLGLTMPGASRFTGMVHVRSIGIPNQIQVANPVHHHLITNEAMDYIPRIAPDNHKGNAGHVLIIGGSKGLTGAPHLAALGALRSGAGLVTIACPGKLADVIKGGSADIMTLPLDSEGEWTPSMAKILLGEISRFDSCVIGPGIGRSAKTVDFLRTFIAECPAHTVLDADALYGLAQFSEKIAELPETTILTPHPGEMATLFDVSIEKIQSSRLETTAQFVDISSATLVLKGAGTLIANVSKTCISPFSEPNLAIGGSGDVLSGMIASLMARGLSPLEASCVGVYWHGMTGRILKKDFPARGNLASEIANTLPLAVKQHMKEFLSC